MKGPAVVKIGGSLMDVIDPLLHSLRNYGMPLLIVPGGGRCADLARETGITGDEAHWMAIAAMEQTGWYIASRGAHPVTTLRVPSGLEVLLPYRLLVRSDPLPHSWDVTSDTISAWVASSLSLPLLVLKSVDGIRSGGVLQERVLADLPTSDVDPLFIRQVLATGVRATILNGRSPGRLDRFLEGDRVPGTTIGF